jgi:hypothetical protein
VNVDTYEARERLILAANRVLVADRLDHSGAHDDAEQEYADDTLAEAAQAYTAAVEHLPGVLVPRERLERLEAIERDWAAGGPVRPWDVQATEQALSDERFAGVNAQVVAAAARAYVEAQVEYMNEGRGYVLDVVAWRALLGSCNATTPSPTRTHTVVAVAELEALREIADEAAIWSISTGPDAGFGLRVALDRWKS